MTAKIEKAYQKLVGDALNRLAQRESGQTIRIQVGSATCENAAGAQLVWQEFEKNIRASGRADIRLHRVGCTGRCSCEPIVGVLVPGKMPVKYERVDAELAHRIFVEHVLNGQPVAAHVLDNADDYDAAWQVLVCDSRHCGACVNGSVARVFREAIDAAELGPRVRLAEVGCLGFCSVPRPEGATTVLIRPSHTVYHVKS
ncbi:MAG TPA: (2Fe-2S) ferredoxin domain-containing protein, partial [Candidatus Hydrogenedentes bacterium]|nr:(2Fe-2S) ferredoxin domain-containing protein [Candidatus Hydrogenedentota bacterium]